MNKVILIGRVAREPDIKFAANTGKAICNFTVAVNRAYKKDGKTEADFISCVAYDKNAENISNFFGKGKQIAIEGHITTGSYDLPDGSKRYTTTVTVDKFEFIDTRQAEAEKSEKVQFNAGDMVEVHDDGDIPF